MARIVVDGKIWLYQVGEHFVNICCPSMKSNFEVGIGELTKVVDTIKYKTHTKKVNRANITENVIKDYIEAKLL